MLGAPGRKVVVRTLDAWSDKPLAFTGMPDEANPALGVRGLRLSLDDPGLLDRQLGAVALAACRAAAQAALAAADPTEGRAAARAAL